MINNILYDLENIQLNMGYCETKDRAYFLERAGELHEKLEEVLNELEDLQHG
jgi:hypothetical protein